MATTTETYITGKAARKTFALLYEPKAGDACELLGKYMDSLTIDQNAEVEDGIDVTGYSYVDVTKGKKTTTIDPLKFNGDSEYAKFIDEAEERELEGDDLLKSYIVARLYKKKGAGFAAYRQQASIEITTVGGDTKAVSLPHTIRWIGPRVYGTYDPVTAKFTADA